MADIIEPNHAPTGNDKTISLFADTFYAFSGSDFGFADIDSGDQLTAVTLSSLPSGGKLTLNGLEVTVGQSVSVADLNAHLLVFTPSAHAVGNPIAAFDFKVTDLGLLSSVNTNQITLNAIPLVESHGTTGNFPQYKWAQYQGNASHTGYADVILNGDFSFAWSQSSIQTYGFNPVAAASGLVFASTSSYFSNQKLSVFDAVTGTEKWSIDFGSINSVNPPSYDNGMVYLQTGNHSSDSWFRGYDAQTGELKIQSPFSAQWERYQAPTIFNGDAYMNGGYFGGAYSFDLATGQQNWFAPLSQYDGWTPAVSDKYVVTYTDSLRVLDPLTGALKNQITDPTYTWTGYTGATPTLSGDHAYVVNSGHLTNFDLIDNAIDWQLSGVSGQIAIDGNEIFAIRNGTLSSINAQTGAVNWVWVNASGSGLSGEVIATQDAVLVSNSQNTYEINRVTHTLSHELNMGGHLALGNGQLYVAGQSTLTAYNISPSGIITLSVTGIEDTAYIFKGSDFGLNAQNQLQIDSLPYSGSLVFNGALATLNQTLSLTELNAGLLSFIPAADANGNNYTAFDFKIVDGTLNPAPTYRLNVNITPANDAPTVVIPIPDQNAKEAHPFSYQFSSTAFNDIDAVLGDMLSYSASLAGGSALPGWLSFNPQTRSFTGTPDHASIGAVTVNVTATDNSQASVTDSFLINIEPDRAPTSTDTSVTMAEDETYIFSSNDFSFSDIDNGDQLKALQINSLPNSGELLFNGSAIYVGQIITSTDLNAGLLTFVPVANAYGDNYAGFDFKVSDGVLFSVTANHLAVNVTPVADELFGTGFADTLTAKDNGDFFIYGYSGNDKLTGLGGDDALYGGKGNDILYGGVGNDLLDGGEGKDKLFGGVGNDVYLVDNAKDVATELANAGVDKIQTWVSLASLASNVENVELVAEGHALNATANKLDNMMTGNQWSNKLSGGAGNDIIFGGDGNDTILGGAGSDILYGQTGKDILDGGAGNDIFVFTWADGQDTIKNFGDKTGNQDIIDLSDFALLSKDLSITSSGKNTVISIEGMDIADFQLTLIGVKVTTLDAGDFLF
ncbi:MAG: putative Ig domain-containing protein [Methylococcales bacterium]|nr:putative Ig domain-containing protein [Methylococcales bacterium]